MKHEYVIIVKVGEKKYLKYHISNLVSFTEFLNRCYSDWKYFNVYDRKTRKQICSFTQRNQPNTKHVDLFTI